MNSNVVMFPNQAGRLAGMHAARFKLLAADKIDICRWESEGGSPFVARIAIHEGTGGCEEDADVALLYAPGLPWARWGAARRGNEILLWRCNDGRDIGLFRSMREALAAVAFGEPGACGEGQALQLVTA